MDAYLHSNLLPDSFVDRDMMMRYLGLGVGHLNPADFPHEIHALDNVHIPDIPTEGVEADDDAEEEPDESESEDEESGPEGEGDELECEY
jgi:hypothetical protein